MGKMTGCYLKVTWLYQTWFSVSDVNGQENAQIVLEWIEKNEGHMGVCSNLIPP